MAARLTRITILQAVVNTQLARGTNNPGQRCWTCDGGTGVIARVTYDRVGRVTDPPITLAFATPYGTIARLALG